MKKAASGVILRGLFRLCLFLVIERGTVVYCVVHLAEYERFLGVQPDPGSAVRRTYDLLVRREFPHGIFASTGVS